MAGKKHMRGISIKPRNGERVLEEMTLKRSHPAGEGREKYADQRTFHLEGPVV